MIFTRRRAFTLVELLIAFAISTVLLGVIWYFFLGFQGLGERGKGKLELNQYAELAMENLVRDMRMAEAVLELRPDRLRIERSALPENLPYQQLAFRSRVVETVTYEVVREERFVSFRRSVGFGDPRELFRVDDCGKEVFEGLVLQNMPSIAERQKMGDAFFWPKLEPFEALGQSSSDLKRIILLRVSFDLKLKKDSISLVSKVFLPSVYQRVTQKDWNPE